MKVTSRKAAKTGGSPLNNLARWLFNNQTALSFNITALLFLLQACIPRARPFTSKFFTLSYYNVYTGKYASGRDDIYFVAFCVVLFTGIRAGLMQYVLTPLARYWRVSSKKDVIRFSEQGWMLMYNSVFWSLGMGAYMLAQWSYWIQQLLVVNLEARRKDYWEMIVHHFATISLIASAYAYHQTRVANLILVSMDVIELLFPLAKCLRYIGFTTICDVTFGIFMVTWFLTRHVFYLMICWSVYSDTPRLMPTACYEGSADDLHGPFPVPDGWLHLLKPFRNPTGVVCMDDGIRKGFLLFLLLLEVVMAMWFVLIIQVAIRVLKGDGAEDVRSDEEGEGEEQEDLEHGQPQILEEEVGVESINFEVWKRRHGVKEASRSSALALPGHSDRKELLNRIGCEKQID
ncbi:hypothetical protein M434DRAFT_20324 [Hypoxylon sp. CO27-5]|nr:hypothetical protein M434DRAFT_20324 [Hypoxylon sp. CO27-5]